MVVEQNTPRQNQLYHCLQRTSLYQQMKMVIIDRYGHIFQYILRFLRCGKLVLPKHDLELIQTEADLYQTEDLILAVKHHKRVVEVKECDGIHMHVMIYGINNTQRLNYSKIQIY